MNDLKKISMDEVFEKLDQADKYHTKDKIDILNALVEKFGEEVIEILEKVEGEKAKKEWNFIAEKVGDNSIESLRLLLWEKLKERGLEYTYEVKENGVQMHCTKCPIFDLAKELNATDLMYHHSCSIDPYLVAGFNPNMGFIRTKTLMQGDGYCDHFYHYK